MTDDFDFDPARDAEILSFFEHIGRGVALICLESNVAEGWEAVAENAVLQRRWLVHNVLTQGELAWPDLPLEMLELAAEGAVAAFNERLTELRLVAAGGSA